MSLQLLLTYLLIIGHDAMAGGAIVVDGVIESTFHEKVDSVTIEVQQTERATT